MSDELSSQQSKLPKVFTSDTPGVGAIIDRLIARIESLETKVKAFECSCCDPVHNEPAFQDMENTQNQEGSTESQRIFEEGFERGYQMGKEEAAVRAMNMEEEFKRGIEEGRKKSLQEISVRLLRQKYPLLPLLYAEHLEVQDPATLQGLLDQIFDFKDISDLELILAQLTDELPRPRAHDSRSKTE